MAARSHLKLFSKSVPVNNVYLQTKAPFGTYRRILGRLIKIPFSIPLFLGLFNDQLWLAGESRDRIEPIMVSAPVQ